MSCVTRTIWAHAYPLILASASKTRADILMTAGFDPLCVTSNVDERWIEESNSHLNPIELSTVIARLKALAVSERYPKQVVIGADQVLAVKDMLFHKPIDLESAMDQLYRLAGLTHHLHAAVTIACDGTILDEFVDSASLTMRVLDRQSIVAYIYREGLANVLTSVGGYRLEGLGVHLFDTIIGDQSTILGLPLIPLLKRLRTHGFLLF